MTKSRAFLTGALVATLSFACAWPAFACVNAFDSDIIGYQRQGNTAAIATIIADLQKSHAEKATLENSNDLAVGLLLTGKLDDSIKLLEETDKKFPGSAKVAANLGTALELSGNNADALTWIREGIKRDATEHQGSEWLHARILEAKIALAKDPKWLDTNRVLELDFGKGDVPTAPEILPIENGKVKGAKQLLDQIGYQLDERKRFVKPPDPIVGDLYASAGDFAIAAAVSPLDDRDSGINPDGFYVSALEYGAPHADLIRKRLARYKADYAALPPRQSTIEVVDADVRPAPSRFERAPVKSNTLWVYVGAAMGFTIVLVAVGMFVDRRRRKRAEAMPSAPLPDVD